MCLEELRKSISFAGLLIRHLAELEEESVARFLPAFGPIGEYDQTLAHRQYAICKRKGRAEDARSCHGQVIGWHELIRLAGELLKDQVLGAVCMRGSETKTEAGGEATIYLGFDCMAVEGLQ